MQRATAAVSSASKRFSSTISAQTINSIKGKATSFLGVAVFYQKVLVNISSILIKGNKLGSLDLTKGISGLTNFTNAFTNGQWRNVTLGDSSKYLIEAAKVLGFFTVGEIIGRGSFVGYHIEGSHVGGHH